MNKFIKELAMTYGVVVGWVGFWYLIWIMITVS